MADSYIFNSSYDTIRRSRYTPGPTELRTSTYTIHRPSHTTYTYRAPVYERTYETTYSSYRPRYYDYEYVTYPTKTVHTTTSTYIPRRSYYSPVSYTYTSAPTYERTTYYRPYSSLYEKPTETYTVKRTTHSPLNETTTTIETPTHTSTYKTYSPLRHSYLYKSMYTPKVPLYETEETTYVYGRPWRYYTVTPSYFTYTSRPYYLSREGRYGVYDYEYPRYTKTTVYEDTPRVVETTTTYSSPRVVETTTVIKDEVLDDLYKTSPAKSRSRLYESYTTAAYSPSASLRASRKLYDASEVAHKYDRATSRSSYRYN